MRPRSRSYISREGLTIPSSPEITIASAREMKSANTLSKCSRANFGAMLVSIPILKPRAFRDLIHASVRSFL